MEWIGAERLVAGHGSYNEAMMANIAMLADGNNHTDYDEIMIARIEANCRNNAMIAEIMPVWFAGERPCS